VLTCLYSVFSGRFVNWENMRNFLKSLIVASLKKLRLHREFVIFTVRVRSLLVFLPGCAVREDICTTGFVLSSLYAVRILLSIVTCCF
jgi:hypothetical protein